MNFLINFGPYKHFLSTISLKMNSRGPTSTKVDNCDILHTSKNTQKLNLNSIYNKSFSVNLDIILSYYITYINYRKVASNKPVYYSILNHFWGATNRDVLKVKQSRKQIMVFSILPKNKRSALFWAYLLKRRCSG